MANSVDPEETLVTIPTDTFANSVDPDDTAHYEPSHLDLHCLHMYLFWSTGLKELTQDNKTNESTKRRKETRKQSGHPLS